MTTKSEEEHEKTQRSLRHKRITKSDSAKKLVRLYSARQVRATVDGSMLERAKTKKHSSKEKEKEKDKDKRKDK